MTHIDWQGALFGAGVFLAVLIVVAAIALLLNAPRMVARHAWRKPTQEPPYEVEAAALAIAISLRVPSPRLPLNDRVSEVSE